MNDVNRVPLDLYTEALARQELTHSPTKLRAYNKDKMNNNKIGMSDRLSEGEHRSERNRLSEGAHRSEGSAASGSRSGSGSGPRSGSEEEEVSGSEQVSGSRSGSRSGSKDHSGSGSDVPPPPTERPVTGH